MKVNILRKWLAWTPRQPDTEALDAQLEAHYAEIGRLHAETARILAPYRNMKPQGLDK